MKTKKDQSFDRPNYCFFTKIPNFKIFFYHFNFNTKLTAKTITLMSLTLFKNYTKVQNYDFDYFKQKKGQSFD